MLVGIKFERVFSSLSIFQFGFHPFIFYKNSRNMLIFMADKLSSNEFAFPVRMQATYSYVWFRLVI